LTAFKTVFSRIRNSPVCSCRSPRGHLAPFVCPYSRAWLRWPGSR